MSLTRQTMHRRIATSPAKQSGAVLYVALVVLILLALIGIAGMQVTGLQEKMSANYRNTNLAFQNAEGQVRLTESECDVEGYCTQIGPDCFSGFDATTWAQNMAMDTPLSDRINICPVADLTPGWGSTDLGIESENKKPPIPHQITVYATNAAANADAAIDTIFIP